MALEKQWKKAAWLRPSPPLWETRNKLLAIWGLNQPMVDLSP